MEDSRKIISQKSYLSINRYLKYFYTQCMNSMNIIMRNEFYCAICLFATSLTVGFVIGYFQKPKVDDDELY